MTDTDPTPTHLDGTVPAEKAPTGILLWPVRKAMYADAYTLDAVIVHDDDSLRPWVEWIYRNGTTRTFNLGEEIAVKVPADCGWTPNPLDYDPADY